MSVKYAVQNFALPCGSKGYVHSPFEFSSHTSVIRRVLGSELRFTQVDEFTGAVLISLFLLRYVDRMHRAGFSCKEFLPSSL